MAKLPKVHLPSAIRGEKLAIRITGRREWAIRAWLGVQLMKLGAWVMGLEVELEWLGAKPDPAHEPSLAIPPSHLSVSDLDKGLATISWNDARRIRVMLDGVEMKRVVAYDCENGWVERHRDSGGILVLRNGELEIERLIGVVTAEYREAA